MNKSAQLLLEFEHVFGVGKKFGERESRGVFRDAVKKTYYIKLVCPNGHEKRFPLAHMRKQVKLGVFHKCQKCTMVMPGMKVGHWTIIKMHNDSPYKFICKCECGWAQNIWQNKLHDQDNNFKKCYKCARGEL